MVGSAANCAAYVEYVRSIAVLATIPSPNSLYAPVGSLMRPSTRVAPEDTLERAASELRRNGGTLVPVIQDDILVGVVTDTSLAIAMAEGRSHLDPARDATVNAVTIAPYATGAEALRRLADENGLPLVVVDDMGRLMGLISAVDLYPRRHAPPRPTTVGGMATPFGVYLTNGEIGAGAKGWPLVTTGATLFLLLFASQEIVTYGLDFGIKQGAAWLDSDLIATVLTGLLFLTGMRLIPLAGTHGAEHQVVHAIERGEELTPEVVRRMPRVHPRCGTNLMAGAVIFTGIAYASWEKGLHLGPLSLDGIREDNQLKFLVAVIVTFFSWRPVGSFLQQYVTTRPPSDRQIAKGIEAGNELLTRFATAKMAKPTIPRRLWNSGLFHVITGSTLTAIALELVFRLFHIELGLW